MRTSPASGSMRRLMNLQVVVFPEPEAPTRAMRLPLFMVRERSLTAKPRPPSKDFDTRWSSIRGADVIGSRSQPYQPARHWSGLWGYGPILGRLKRTAGAWA